MSQLLRIGVIYDGGYLSYINGCYAARPDARGRLATRGLKRIAQDLLSKGEGVEVRYCKIVGELCLRRRASGAYDGRDDAAPMFDGPAVHAYPYRLAEGNKEANRAAADAAFALECYAQAARGDWDAIALFACDGSFAPVIRRIAALGVRTLLLAWEPDPVDIAEGRRPLPAISREAIEEAAYTTNMRAYIESMIEGEDPALEDLFAKRMSFTEDGEAVDLDSLPRARGAIVALKTGFGFVERSPSNVFFHHSDITGCEFVDLREGDIVDYHLFEGGGRNGSDVAKNVRLASVGGVSDPDDAEEFVPGAAGDGDAAEDAPAEDAKDDEAKA